MFSNTGLFSTIACPLGKDCDLLDCLFLHHDSVQAGSDAMEIHRVSHGIKEPQVERQKVPVNTTHVDNQHTSTAVQPTPAFGGILTLKKTQTPGKAKPDAGTKVKNNAEPKPATHAARVLTDKRLVSPPPLRKPQQSTPTTSVKLHGLPIKLSTEPLNPRMLVQAPTAHQTRLLYLKKLHEGMVALNDKAKEDPKMGKFILSQPQLTTLALDEEQKIAVENFSIYPNMIKLRMVAYKKMTIEAWKLHLLEVTQLGESLKSKKSQPMINGERDLRTGLCEPEERQILSHLSAKQHGLEEFGYVTGVPNSEDLAVAQRGEEAAKGWEKCARCQARFQVFPDRNEDGLLTTGGQCVFHPGRIMHGFKGRESAYSCCNGTVSSAAGCDTYPCHVFKVESPKRLALVMQYQNTPGNPDVSNDKAVSLDCEMGYTALGFELIRLTVLSWPKGEKLLDILVRPFGYLLDPNTRYSGVSAEQFQEAIPYDPSTSPDALHMVGSPTEAREILFKHIGPSTPIVGHGLDNDLAALRLIHPCIVDTALLCPHSRGLPYRRALKQLARDYLFRTIQNAGIAGHDSAEDAKAAGDVVLELVKRKWRKMKEAGWKSEDGKLVPPKMVPVQTGKQHENGENQNHEEAVKYDEASAMEDMRVLNRQNGRKRSSDELDDEMGEAPAVQLDYD